MLDTQVHNLHGLLQEIAQSTTSRRCFIAFSMPFNRATKKTGVIEDVGTEDKSGCAEM
jgi:hypothetical protein